jgi:biotin operon repressor
MNITRAEWRDSIDRSGLTPKARAVAKLIADFWKDESTELWTPIDVLTDRTGLSRATVYRAMEELQTYGYLVQVEKYRQHRSPRYLPLLAKAGSGAKADKPRGLNQRIQRSQDENPEVSTGYPSPHRAPTESTPGSEDQDYESRSAFADRQMTAAQKKDRLKLASYMANYSDQNLDIVYWAMRDGRSPNGERSTPIDRPGSYAANRSKVVSEVPGLNAWQGHFLRHFVKDRDAHPAPTTAATADPWATSKSA